MPPQSTILDAQQQSSKQTSIASMSTKTMQRLTSNGEKVQIFLGGSCNPTTWRQTIAIPYLELNGISYYNPQVDDWTPEVVNVERHAKKNADLLLFVIDKQTRSTVSLVESAFMAGIGKRLVLVIYPFDYSIDHLSIKSDTKQTSNVVETHEETTTTSTTKHAKNSLKLQATSSSKSSTTFKSVMTCSSNFATGTIRVNGESISLGEFQELRHARYILQSLVSSMKIPIFFDIPQALNYVSSSLLSREQSFECDSDKDPPHKNSVCIESSKNDDNETGPRSESSKMKDVYLSLDDNDDSNFESTVIPILQEKGLTFDYKPVSSISRLSARSTSLTSSKNVRLAIDDAGSVYSTEEDEQKMIQNSRLALEKEMRAIQNSRVVLFVITNRCRGLSIMVLASHFMALFRRNVVLCIQYLEEPCCINGELLTKNAIADYNRGRVYLGDYASESQVPVFGSIREAVDCCSQKCGYTSANVTNRKSEAILQS